MQIPSIPILVPTQGRVQDLTKGGAHVHAQIIDGCGLSYCSETDCKYFKKTCVYR